ncbi:MAG: ATP-dependent RNA helicase HrpA, partial [Desulfocapsaceae bacterium]|nr:ATP-dependent RNA helicase HrpA [Desulfocapsaceae bacterium]
REEIAALIRDHQVTVIAGDTGSGKTTQLPKICLETLPQLKNLVGCTQPRRVAATTVADRVAQELGEKRAIVGSKIRFYDKTTSTTKIKFMTDGVLLAETKQDPLLKSYDVIIVDEAHERSLNIDFLLGYLKNLISRRKDLKLVITSATIDTQLFSDHFGGAPVYEIEGRNYPVEIIYQEGEDEDGDSSFIEDCVDTVSMIAQSYPPGDMLVFMPTEKDIKTSVEILQGRLQNHTVLPMFGRLQFSDQQKIFSQHNGYKVVVATNVAETSVTVPGIRYVIDTGLARISSYNPRSRTTVLPVTRVSQASCNQRAGRCGRIGPGTCFRLYSKDDFLSRPEYTVPEIKRSNLAEVLLQMISLKLGNPAEFPFLEPPAPSAVREGYRLLEELDAITINKRLSADGRLMARLPIDPIISRVIIEASRNGCLSEMIIIASALAIQDPRVRPADKEVQADEAHKTFYHPSSDFMVLLAIWNTFSDRNRQFSWSGLKRFSKEHFLSFQRMREWFDLHDQLQGILKKHKAFSINRENGTYEQIHRSLLSGFFRLVARRRKSSVYINDQGKEIMVFPGSMQFSKSGEWIVSGSAIETGRLYAMTVATIEPEWIEAAARSFCSYSWSNVRWQKKTGRVIADETVSLRSLVICSGRTVNFPKRSKKNLPEARAVFIQKALVEEGLDDDFHFLKHNREILKKWQAAEDKLRKKDIVIHDESIYSFYEKNIPPGVCDRTSLIRYLKNSSGNELLMTKEQILLRQPAESELLDFPAVLDLGVGQVKLSYHFQPGDEQDGITALMPLSLIHVVKADIFDWLVPGLLPEKTTFLLKGLPKRLRKHLIPVSTTVERILDSLVLYRGNYYQRLSASVFKMFKVSIRRDDWPQQLPPHLQMRFALLDQDGSELASGRDLSLLKSRFNKSDRPQKESNLKPEDEKLIASLQEKLFTSWDFDSIPGEIPIYSRDGKPCGFRFAALKRQPSKQGVSVFYAGTKEEARSVNAAGTRYLLQRAFKDQYKLLRQHCRVAFSGPSVEWLKQSCSTPVTMLDQLLDFVDTALFGSQFEPIISRHQFQEMVNTTKISGYYKRGRELVDQVLLVLRERKEVADLIRKLERLSDKSGASKTDIFADINRQLEKTLPPDFLQTYSQERLVDSKRYLKSLEIRTHRAYANPVKDLEKQKRIVPHINNLRNFRKQLDEFNIDLTECFLNYSFLIAEYQVSLFSPEVKTKITVSEKKLKAAWKHLNEHY